MSKLERKYVQELLTEIETIEQNRKEIAIKLDETNTNLQTKTKAYQEVIDENNSLRKEIDHLKQNVLCTKQTTITNPNVINIFKQLKNGEVIEFIKPLYNKRYKKFKTHPFLFQMENKGAFYDGELVGMFEIKKGNIYYFNEKTPDKSLIGEIGRQYLHINDECMDCTYKGIGSKKGKNVNDLQWGKLFKLNPIINITSNKFVSIDNNKWIYTKQDGSKYIILENGEKEII